jgi:hypothetical protein
VFSPISNINNPIKRQSTLMLDGTDDYLTTGVGDLTAAGGGSHTFFVRTRGTGYIGGFNSNLDGSVSLNLLIRIWVFLNAGQTMYVSWQNIYDNAGLIAAYDQIAGQTPGGESWVNVVVSLDSSDWASSLCYVNGYKIKESIQAGLSGTADTPGGGYSIGRIGTTYYNGGFSEFAYYNKSLTDAECVALSNNGLPYNHNEGALAGSLAAWYRFGDDENHATTFGSQVGNFIEDSANPGFGTDVITNGRFAADTDWNKGDFTIGSGVATVTTDGGNQYIQQLNLWSNNANDGRVLELKYEIVANTDNIALKTGAFGSNDVTSNALTLTSTVGEHTAYLFVNGSNNADSLTLWCNHTAGETLTIDSVKLRVSRGFPAYIQSMTASNFSGEQINV